MKHLFLGVLLVLLVGCVAYEPRPIDWSEELAQWTNAVSRLELSLEDVKVRARVMSAELNALRLEYANSKKVADASGWWNDPSLDVDLMRILRAPEHPFTGGATVSLTLPLTGIPALEEKAAQFYAEEAYWKIVDAEIRVATDAAVDALTSGELQRLEAEIETVLSEGTYANALSVARRLVEVGEFPRTDLLTLEGERREFRQTLSELRHERLDAEKALRQVLRVVPGCEIALQAEDWNISTPDHFHTLLDFTNAPAVRAAVERLSGGETELQIEIARQYPELTLGPSYTHEDGYNRIGITAGLTLPLWNRNRVGIATKTGGRDAARQAAVEAWRDSVLAWEALQREREVAHRPADLPRVDPSEREGVARLYRAGEMTAGDYVGVVHRNLFATIAVARRRIDVRKLALKMQGVCEGLEKKDTRK